MTDDQTPDPIDEAENETLEALFGWAAALALAADLATPAAARRVRGVAERALARIAERERRIAERAEGRKAQTVAADEAPQAAERAAQYVIRHAHLGTQVHPHTAEEYAAHVWLPAGGEFIAEATPHGTEIRRVRDAARQQAEDRSKLSVVPAPESQATGDPYLGMVRAGNADANRALSRFIIETLVNTSDGFCGAVPGDNTWWTFTNRSNPSRPWLDQLQAPEWNDVTLHGPDGKWVRASVSIDIVDGIL